MASSKAPAGRPIYCLVMFPNLYRCFKAINADQPYPDGVTGRPMPNAEIPAKWAERFRVAEKVLLEIGDNKPADFGVGARAKGEYGCDDAYEGIEEPYLACTIREIIALPVNEDDVVVMRAAGRTPREINAVRAVMNEFFDGYDLWSLRHNFTKLEEV